MLQQLSTFFNSNCVSAASHPGQHFQTLSSQDRVSHLLQQDSVVSLEGLEDVMVAAQLAQAVDGCVAMAATALAAHREGIGSVGSRVRLEPC